MTTSVDVRAGHLLYTRPKQAEFSSGSSRSNILAQRCILSDRLTRRCLSNLGILLILESYRTYQTAGKAIAQGCFLAVDTGFLAGSRRPASGRPPVERG